MNINQNTTIYGTITGYDNTNTVLSSSQFSTNLPFAIRGGGFIGGNLKVVGSIFSASNIDADNSVCAVRLGTKANKSANVVGTSVGSINTPVYFSNGVPVVACIVNSSNVVLGTSAFNNSSGANNIAIGQSAIGNNGSSSVLYSVAIGTSALSKVTGASNIGIGYTAGINVTSGNNNTIVGSASGTGVTSGANNTIVGSTSGSGITTGNDNTVVGKSSVANGSQNVAVGSTSGGNSSTSVNNIAIGYGAPNKGSNVATIGNSNVTDVYMSADSGATTHSMAYKINERVTISFDSSLGVVFSFN